MKKIFPLKFYVIFTLMLILATNGIIAQSNVGVGTTSPDASAKLEVSSTTQGFLMPRMTEAQRNAIISPATGLMVYQTNNSDGTYYYDGTQWRNLSDNLGNHTATTTLNMDTNQIVNVPTPINGLDAVNKDYVDAAISGGGGGGVGSGSGCTLPTEISLESPSLSNLSAARSYCDTLNEGGNTDWFVPELCQLDYALFFGISVPGTLTSNELWTRSRPELMSNTRITMRAADLSIDFRSPSISGMRVRCIR